MLTYTALGTYVLVLTLAAVLVLAIVVAQERRGKGIDLWLASLIGVLIGLGGAAAAVQLSGFELVAASPEGYITRDGSQPDPTLGATSPPGGGSSAPAAGGSGPGGPGGMGGGPGGMGGGGMGGGGPGGGRGPSPKRQLTTLVRKIDLLTGDIALHLTPEQSRSLAELLRRVAAQEEMSDEQAAAAEAEFMAILTDEQKAKQESIALPFRRGGGGGFGGGGPGGGPGGGNEDPSANPLQSEENAAALKSLLSRLGSSDG